MSLPNPTFIGQQETVGDKTYQAFSVNPPVWKAITTGTHGTRLQTLEDFVKDRSITKFYSVETMKASNKVKEGDIVQTGSYSSLPFNQAMGSAIYDIVTLEEFGSTPDEIGDHTCQGGLVAVLRKDSEVKVTQYGVLNVDPTKDKAALRAAVNSLKNVHFDIPEVNVTLGLAESLFELSVNHKEIKHRGPCMIRVNAVANNYCYLYNPRGAHDIVVEDIYCQDIVNTVDNMTGQSALVYLRVNDDGLGTYRFRLVRPKMFGGSALFQPIGTASGTTANQCSILDGHVENTYYGVNCAASGNGLRGNIRCINVGRAYFVYDCEDHDFVVQSERPASSNAHFLLKSYDPTKGLKNIRAHLTVSNDQIAGVGRLAFEHQDELTDNSVIENIEVTLIDKRTLDNLSVVFRTWETPSTQKQFSSSTLSNITIKGQAMPPYFSTGYNKPVVLDWQARDPRAGTYIGVRDLFSYQALIQNDTYSAVLFKEGSKYHVSKEGLVGVGMEYRLQLGELLRVTGDNFVTIKCNVSILQGNVNSMTNHCSYEFTLLCSIVGGVTSVTKSPNYNVVFTGGGEIPLNVYALNDDIHFDSDALGSSQFMVMTMEFV